MADTKLSVNDHFMIRRKEQTDIAVKQQNDEIRERNLDPNSTAAKGISRHYGTYTTRCLFENVDVDPHTQSWNDISHNFFYGVTKLAIKEILTGLKPRQRMDFQIRLRDFPWPKGTNPPVVEVTAEFTGGGLTMDMFRCVGYAASHVLDGLASLKELQFLSLVSKCAAQVRAQFPAYTV